MSKLLLKEQPLKDSVVQSLTNSITHMTDAAQKTYSMDVPGGFSRYSEMEKCKDDIVQLNKDLQELRKWINSSCKILDDTFSSMNNEALFLPTSQLKERKEIIN